MAVLVPTRCGTGACTSFSIRSRLDYRASSLKASSPENPSTGGGHMPGNGCRRSGQRFRFRVIVIRRTLINRHRKNLVQDCFSSIPRIFPAADPPSPEAACAHCITEKPAKSLDTVIPDPGYRYFLKVLAVTLTARANASAKGRRIQTGCRLTGDTRYSTQADRNNGREAFLA